MSIRQWLNALWTWIQRRPRTALAIYWLAAFVVTHIPPLREPDPDAPPRLIPFDKIVHFFGFAALAWLLMNVLTRRLGLVASVGLTILICGIYGVFDELTQRPFNRTADVWDWVADMAGCGMGVGLYAVTGSEGRRDTKAARMATSAE